LYVKNIELGVVISAESGFAPGGGGGGAVNCRRVSVARSIFGGWRLTFDMGLTKTIDGYRNR
jgi:hypothetical protein